MALIKDIVAKTVEDIHQRKKDFRQQNWVMSGQYVHLGLHLQQKARDSTAAATTASSSSGSSGTDSSSSSTSWGGASGTLEVDADTEGSFFTQYAEDPREAVLGDWRLWNEAFSTRLNPALLATTELCAQAQFETEKGVKHSDDEIQVTAGLTRAPCPLVEKRGLLLSSPCP